MTIQSKLRTHAAWLLPLLLFALIAPLTPWLDIAIERYFYSLNGDDTPFYNNTFLQLLYDFGNLPAFTLIALSLAALPLSYLFSPLTYLRKPALFAILTMLIGAGILTHLVLKDHWGRPRPKQVIEFGGTQEYRHFWSPNFSAQPEPSKSFPCGHCTMGFFFLAPALAARRAGRPGMSSLFFVSAFALGGALGIARMAQGGHFLSDVLFTALLMWLTALVLEQLIYGKQQ